MLLTDFKSKGGPLQSIIMLFYVSNKQQNTYNLTLFQTDVQVFLTRLTSKLSSFFMTQILKLGSNKVTPTISRSY